MSAMQKTYAAPLDMPLPFPEDQEGNMKLPEGKNKGCTFLETVEKDYKYAQWMVNHKNLTSDWAKSFQEFVKAWNQMTMGTIQSVAAPRPMAKSKMSPWQGLGEDWSENEEELIVIPDGEKTEGKLHVPGKRSLPVEKDDRMMTEVNTELVAQLQGQIAVLQRELSQAATSSVPQ
eukprot:s3655_g2.t1